MPIRKRWMVGASTLMCALIFGVSVLSSLPAQGTDDHAPGDPKRGRNLILKKGCMRCHSIWQTGGNRGPNLSSVGMGRNLYELCASIWTHWTQMSAAMEEAKTGRIMLKADEFKDLVAYLYYVNYFAEPGDPSPGMTIFQEKGCARCHAREPVMNNNMPGRPVYEMTEFQGPIALAVAVWNHGNDMISKMNRVGIAWPEFADSEVANLVAYIRSRTPSRRGDEMSLPGDFANGRSLFQSKGCASCHRDSGGKGPDLGSSMKPARLSELIASLWNHYPKMTHTIGNEGGSVPRIATGEMEDIVAYLYWTRALGLDGSASNGKRVYASKNCGSCHSSREDAGGVAPNLAGSATAESVYAFMSAIWNHGFKMESKLREQKSSWPAMTGEEIRDLIAFLRAEGRTRSHGVLEQEHTAR